MYINRDTQIIINDDLIRKIVYSINKASTDDLSQYLKENRQETNNSIPFLKGDMINTNLRNHVVKDDIDIISFNRCGWEGRIIIDKNEHITYSITTEVTLDKILKSNNRKSPHYLQSFVYILNKKCIAREQQMTLDDFGVTTFDTGVLENDFKKISQGKIDLEQNYRHYVIVYKLENKKIKNIKLMLFDRNFSIVDEKSLMGYIKPDFATLTDIESFEYSNENKKNLVAIKSGIKPRLKVFNEKAIK